LDVIMALRWKHALAPLLALATLAACAAPQDDAADESGSSEDAIVATVTPAEREAVENTSIKGYGFDHLTPTGTHLFKAAVYWKSHQLEDPRYPVARMCASNVSKTLYLGGITEFNAEGVYNLIRSVGSQGGEVHRLPMPAKSDAGHLDKTAFLAALNAIDHGKIPTGTIVAGCLTSKCDAMPGEQHVGIVGNADPDGTVWVWHNNWYRPENEGGAWKPFMVYGENHDLYTVKGLRREWMPTPWLRLSRDGTGKIVDAVSLVPAIDDLDPFGGAYGGTPKYFMTLALIPELAADLHGK
jgi:hypothetical protein